MIRYHFDLYPRDDPKNGSRLVRFTKLQSAEYRGEANGTGSGRFSIRADTAEAQFIDPAGLQYVRVVREDTVAVTEAVVGGFFLDAGDFSALDERGTRLLTFGGAGTLSYLSRSIMASHTYLSNDIDPGLGAFDDAMDPFDDTWRLYAQGFGDALGSMLWRVIKEASLAPSGAYSHRHIAVGDITDSHADDRPETAIPDLVMTFDYTDDSSSVAWTQTSGEFKAQVGENVLAVVQRLMQAGLYVEMDPDTFELNAWEADTHRRTRTGTVWGPTVVYFTQPTGDDIDTANIKSDAKRRISAFIKRSWLLAGGKDIYADATGTTDIPWEGHYYDDSADTTALADVATTQIGARDDAGDVSDIRGRLGTDTSSGYYRPFEDARLDDLVTVHTGTSSMDLDDQNFPIAAIRLSLRAGGDWDVWYELGSSYAASASRQFQVTATPAHNHPPNPELCRPGTPGGAAILHDYDDTGMAGSSNPGTLAGPTSVDSGHTGRVLYAVFGCYGQATVADVDDVTATWRPNGGHGISPTDGQQTMTRILSTNAGGESAAIVFRLVDPNPSATGPIIVLGSVGDMHVYAAGWFYVTDADTSSPESDTATGTGTGGETSVSGFTPGGDLTIDFAAWPFQQTVTNIPPTVSGDQNKAFAVAGSAANRRIRAGGGYGGTDPKWTTSLSQPWHAVAVAIAGVGSGTAGDGHPDLVGTSIRATRCDHRHDVHRGSAPTVNDDASQGYKLGTIWAELDDLDNPTEIVGTWMLIDATAGAAVWLPLSAGLTSSEIQALIDATVANYVTRFGGTPVALRTIAAADDAEELDLTDYSAFELSLTEDCEITFAGWTNGDLCMASVGIHTNGFDWSMPGLTWVGGVTPTPSGGTDWIIVWSTDGGVTKYGSPGTGSGIVDADDVRDAGRWEVVVSGTAPPVAVTNEAEDDWVYGWVSD